MTPLVAYAQVAVYAAVYIRRAFINTAEGYFHTRFGCGLSLWGLNLEVPISCVVTAVTPATSGWYRLLLPNYTRTTLP